MYICTVYSVHLSYSISEALPVAMYKYEYYYYCSEFLPPE